VDCRAFRFSISYNRSDCQSDWRSRPSYNCTDDDNNYAAAAADDDDGNGDLLCCSGYNEFLLDMYG